MPRNDDSMYSGERLEAERKGQLVAADFDRPQGAVIRLKNSYRIPFRATSVRGRERTSCCELGFMEKRLAPLLLGRQGHFRLESGHHGDLWFSLETLCLQPRVIRPLAAELAAQLKQYKVEVICGPLVEGAFMALMVALELGCDFVYAERFQDTTREGLFPVKYCLPKALQPIVKGKRVAIVNDVINAGSAVRGAFYDLQANGAEILAIGALLALGDAIVHFADQKRVALEIVGTS